MRAPYRSRCRAGPSLKLLQLPPNATDQDCPLVLQTRHFHIFHDWYDVWLCLPDRDPLSVGTHFDEPRAVVVSPLGDWCASGGCGVVIYFLRTPYCSFESGVASDQWWEIGRDEDDPWHVDRLRILGAGLLRIVVDPESTHAGVYDVDLLRRAIRRRSLVAVRRSRV